MMDALREWKPWECFRLIFGYLPEIDRVPDTARKLGLLCRVAAVLYDDEIPHSLFYWDLVEAFVESLPGDSVTFEIETDKDLLVFSSASLLRRSADGCPELGIPFNRATFYLRGRGQAFIDVEPWAMIGGPDPYHDSWTFAIYRETEDVTQLRDACYRVCAKHGLPFLEEIRGLAAPKEAPLWKRFLRWLLR